MFQEIELSSSNIKRILVFVEMKPCTFRPQPSKFFSKNTPSEFLIFSQKKTFLIFYGNKTLHFSPLTQKMKKTFPRENFLRLRKRKHRKNFSCFGKTDTLKKGRASLVHAKDVKVLEKHPKLEVVINFK